VPALACTTEVSSSYPFPLLAPVLKDHADHRSCSFQVNTIVTVPTLACTTETIARALSSHFSCSHSPTLVASTFIYYHTIDPKVCNNSLPCSFPALNPFPPLFVLALPLSISSFPILPVPLVFRQDSSPSPPCCCCACCELPFYNTF
jgi:hypothetical protein